jgi:hypothetical protein
MSIFKIIYACITFFPLLDPVNSIPTYLYLSAAIIIYLIIIQSYGNYSIINPVSFVSLYFYFSLLIGDIFIGNNLIEHENLTVDLLENDKIDKSIIIKIYIILIWIFNISNLMNAKNYKYINHEQNNKIITLSSSKHKYILSTPLILAPLLLVDINIETIFFKGYITHYLAIYVCYALLVSNHVSTRRFLMLFAACLVLMTIKFYGDRREIIYFTYGALFLYVIRYRPRNNFFIKIIIVIPFIVFLILISTILRSGSGVLEFILNFKEYSDVINKYFEIENFFYFLAINSDAGNFYVHGVKSMQIILSDSVNLLFGSTYLKSLFLFIPREIFPGLKPDSMLSIYTTHIDPSYRSAGNSYPINFMAEAVWNFYILSSLFIYYFGKILNYIHMNILIKFMKYSNFKIILLFSMISPVMNFVRGSGFEYIIYSGFIFIFIFIIHKIQNITILNLMKK